MNATGNAVVATEILLGIYEEPNIPKHALLYKTPATFVSFNKYTNKVKYVTDTFTTKNLYFDSEELANECVEYDPSKGRNFYHRKAGNYKKEFQIITEEFNTISLEDWMEGSERIKNYLNSLDIK